MNLAVVSFKLKNIKFSLIKWAFRSNVKANYELGDLRMKIIASVLAASLICSAAAIVPQTSGFSVSANADVCTAAVHGSLTYNEYSDHAEVLQCNTSAAGAIDIQIWQQV